MREKGLGLPVYRIQPEVALQSVELNIVRTGVLHRVIVGYYCSSCEIKDSSKMIPQICHTVWVSREGQFMLGRYYYYLCVEDLFLFLGTA